MNSFKQLNLFLLFLLIYNIGHSQEYASAVRFFNTTDGLPDNAVHTIYQDTNNFIWIGTRFGLSRFDGYNFKNWTRRSHGYNFERISRIGQDDAGWLWLWNNEGILFLNPITEEILTESERFKDGIPFDSQLKTLGSWKYWSNRFIPADQNGKLYFIANNPNRLISYSTKEGFVVQPIPFNKPLSIKRVTGEKYAWAVSENKLLQLNLNGQLHKEYTFAKNEYVSNVFEAKDGIITNTVIAERVKANKIFTINKKGEKEQLPILSQGDGNIFYNDKQEFLLVAANEKWNIYNKNSQTVTSVNPKDYNQQLYLQNNSIYKDKSGRYWMGSDFGLTLMTVEPNNFRNFFSFKSYEKKPYNNSARGMLVQGKNLYVNFEMGGLTKIALDSSNYNTWTLLDRTLGMSKISIENGRYPYWGRPILKTTEDNIWVGSDASIRKYDLNGTLLTEYPLNSEKNSLQLKDTWSLFEENNQIWIGTGNGLAIKRANREKISLLETESIWQLENAVIFHILPADETHFWLCSNEGLYLFNHQEEKVIALYNKKGEGAYQFPVNNIRHLLQEKSNPDIYWIASTEGLLRWNKQTGDKLHFIQSDGLIGEILTAVYEDDFGHIWIGSDKSIMRINKKDFSIQAYLSKDGTQKEYNRISSYQDEDGTIYLGGVNGITSFHPKDFFTAKDSNDSPLLITDYQHFDGISNKIKHIACSGKQDLTITLRPADRFFTLELARLNYESTGINSYAYKIEGLDEDWVKQPGRQFWFGRMPYGNHKLHFKSTNKRDNSESQISVNIDVIKPYYLQAWFLAFMATLVGLIIYGYGKWRNYQLEQQKQHLEIEIKKATTKIREDKAVIEAQAETLKELNETKDRLFAIIGHDLRKPALAFRGISKKVNFLIQQKEFDTLNKLGDNLERSAFSLNGLLDNLLNWALKQRDVLPYAPKSVNIQEATEEIFNLFQQIAHEKNIHLELNVAAKLKAYSDPNALNTIIRNLVDNAIKYTPRGGRVEVISELNGSNIRILVKDTGEGMNKTQLDNIFVLQKNKSTQGTAGEKGSGLGLALVKDLVDLNKGQIKVSSTLKKGTTFEIMLPAA